MTDKTPNYFDHNLTDEEIAAEFEYDEPAITHQDIIGYIKVSLRIAGELFADAAPDTQIREAEHEGCIHTTSDNQEA